MKRMYLPALAVLIFLCGCARPMPDSSATADASVEKCPIHNVAFLKGPGKLPEGMTVSWAEKVYDAMEKYPYVRRDSSESSTVKYCTLCEEAVENEIKSKKKDSQQTN